MPKQHLKVLHCIGIFSQLSETFIYELIQGLDEIGITNYVVTERRINQEDRPYKNIFEIPQKNKAPFFIRKYNRHIKKDRSLNFKYKIKYREWNELLLKLSPDLIHCHFGYAGHLIFNILEKFGLNIPLLVSFHGADTLLDPKRNRYYKEALLSLSQNYRCLFTCPSHFLCKKALESLEISKEQLHCVPNGFATKFYSVYRDTNRSLKKNYSIINIARFVTFKGQSYLVKAFDRFLKQTTDKARLTLVGYGEKKDELMRLVERLGITQKVDFIESVPHSSIPSLLKQHDLYVQPSIIDPNTGHTESFGVSILEAVAVGLPVIVTDSGGMPDTILGGDGKTGIIVPEKNVPALYEAMESIFLNYSGINSELRRNIINRYSLSNNVNAIHNLYQELIR